MIYMKGDEKKNPVTVVGCKPEDNLIHFIEPETGKFKSWDINRFFADDGFHEISKTATEAQHKHKKLWPWWKESINKTIHEYPNSPYRHMDNKKIEKECKGIPGFCWAKSQEVLHELLEQGEKK